jgi:hypothetical protein
MSPHLGRAAHRKGSMGRHNTASREALQAAWTAKRPAAAISWPYDQQHSPPQTHSDPHESETEVVTAENGAMWTRRSPRRPPRRSSGQGKRSHSPKTCRLCLPPQCRRKRVVRRVERRSLPDVHLASARLPLVSWAELRHTQTCGEPIGPAWFVNSLGADPSTLRDRWYHIVSPCESADMQLP